MFNFFKKKKNSSLLDQLQSEPIFKIHTEYWSPNPDEKDDLLSKYPNKLTDKKQLRLLHLICIERLNSKTGRKHLDEESFDNELSWNTVSKDICVKIVENFLNKKSRFCSKKCFIWQGSPGETQEQEPELNLQGDFLNASLTHLGCLEVIKVDDNQNPTEVDFIPFDEIGAVIFTVSRCKNFL